MKHLNIIFNQFSHRMKKFFVLLIAIYSVANCSNQHIHGNEEVLPDISENLETNLPIGTDHENQQFDSDTLMPLTDDEQNDNLDFASSVPPDNFPDYLKLKSENYHVGDVSVEIDIEYNLDSYNNFYIYGIFESQIDDNAHTTDTFFQYRFRDVVEQDAQIAKGSVKVMVQLPTELIYYDHQNKSTPTNYFANKIKFETRLVIMDPQDGFEVTSVEMDSLSLLVPDPWSRKQMPLYSLNWYSQLLETMKNNSVPKCNHHSSK